MNPNFTVNTQMSRSDIFDLVSNDFFGDLSEQVQGDFFTPSEVFTQVEAMRQIIDSVVAAIPNFGVFAVYLDQDTRTLIRCDRLD